LFVVDGDIRSLCEDRKTIMPLKTLPGDEITGVNRAMVVWGVWIEAPAIALLKMETNGFYVMELSR
jgi:hypothetical protein